MIIASQGEKRRHCRLEEAVRKGQSQVDRERCLNMIWPEMRDVCQEMHVLLWGLELCESTSCTDVSEVLKWVEKELEADRAKMLALEDCFCDGRHMLGHRDGRQEGQRDLCQAWCA